MLSSTNTNIEALSSNGPHIGPNFRIDVSCNDTLTSGQSSLSRDVEIAFGEVTVIVCGPATSSTLPIMQRSRFRGASAAHDGTEPQDMGIYIEAGTFGRYDFQVKSFA